MRHDVRMHVRMGLLDKMEIEERITRMDYISLGYRVRKQRQAIHLTQDRLAEKASISLSFLGHIERGSRKASIETLVNLANALGVSADFLLQDSLDIKESPFIPTVRNERQRAVLNEISRLISENMDAWVDD